MARLILCAAGLAAMAVAACGERNASTPPVASATAPVDAAPIDASEAGDAESGADAASDRGRDAVAETRTARPEPSSARTVARPARPARPDAAAKPRRTQAAASAGSTARPYSAAGPGDGQVDPLPPVEVRRRTRPMTVQEELDMNRALLSPGGASSGATAPRQR